MEQNDSSFAHYWPLAPRVAIGVIFVAHGAQKLFGAFGGGGIGGTAGFLGDVGFAPALLWAWVLAVVEFFGGLFVLVGFKTRLAALLIGISQLVAIAVVHGKNGLFLRDGGFEYNLAILGCLVALVLAGAGPLAVDRFRGRAVAEETMA